MNVRVALVLGGLMSFAAWCTLSPVASANPRDGDDALPVQGPCCLPDHTCVIMYEPNCREEGGTWWGPNLDCESVNCQPPCPADLDGSGVVDPDDLIIFLQCFPGGDCPKDVDGDLNDDGSVNDIDIDLFLEALDEGKCPQ